MTVCNTSKQLNIGQAAAASGVPAKTIRYYEQVSLLPKAHRAPNGYRLYDAAAVERLRFIRRARDLGFVLSGVAELLTLYDNPNRTARDVRTLATQHLKTVDAKLVELSALRRTLATLVDACPGSDDSDCPILNDLTHSSESP